MFGSWSRRLDRVRVVAADKAFPGGLIAHRVPLDPAPVALAPAAPSLPAGLLIEELADRYVPTVQYLRLNGPLRCEFAALITDEEITILDGLLSARERAFLSGHHGVALRSWQVAVAVHHGLPGFSQRTGLSAAVPPPEVHAMYHETWAAGGDPVYPDMIDCALRDAGHQLAAGQRVLDFGCSSGRVVRTFDALRPTLDWAGCDVNVDAITWAAEAFPDVEFQIQPLRPPLAWPDEYFDAAYAISIWSHYAMEPALAWFEEMRRVIRMGGALLFTSHGPGAVAARAADPNHGMAGQVPIAAELYRDGFSFVDLYAGTGDWGVVDGGWGASFATPEWLLAHLTPHWSVRLYRPAAIDGHQDLIVLRREQ